MFWANLDGTTKDYTGNFDTRFDGWAGYIDDDQLGRKVGIFDGNSLVDIDTINWGLSSSSDITYAAMFYIEKDLPSDNALIGVESGDWERTGLYTINDSNNGKYALEFSIGYESTSRRGYASYDKNKWYHLVGTLNGNNKRLYFNNQLLYSLTDSTKLAFNSCCNMSLGGWFNGSWEPASRRNLEGRLCSCGVWGRALSSDEVNELYNDGLGLIYS